MKTDISTLQNTSRKLKIRIDENTKMLSILTIGISEKIGMQWQGKEEMVFFDFRNWNLHYNCLLKTFNIKNILILWGKYVIVTNAGF